MSQDPMERIAHEISRLGEKVRKQTEETMTTNELLAELIQAVKENTESHESRG